MVNGLKQMKKSGGFQNIKFARGDRMKLLTRLLTKNLQRVLCMDYVTT